MRTSAKKLKIIGVTIFSLGLALLATGWIMGANFMLYLDGVNVRFANEHSVTLSSNLEFSSISITSNIADIEIIATNSPFSASFLTYFNDVHFNYSIERDTLVIEIYKTPSLLLPIGFISMKSTLTMNIPSELTLYSVAINNSSNNTMIDGINSSHLRIDSTSGNVGIYGTNSALGNIYLVDGSGIFNNVNFSLLEFGSVSGNNTFTNSVFNEIIASSGRDANFIFYNCDAYSFRVNTRYGTITAEDLTTNIMYVHNVFGNVTLAGTFNNRSEISNNTGNTTLIIAASETDFGYNLSTHGNVSINGEVVARTLADRGASNHLRVISRSGNIMVTFSDDMY